MEQKASDQEKKKMICQISESFDENWRNGRRFINSVNFAPHAFLTLAPPSGYGLNLKALIKVSKVS